MWGRYNSDFAGRCEINNRASSHKSEWREGTRHDNEGSLNAWAGSLADR